MPFSPTEKTIVLEATSEMVSVAERMMPVFESPLNEMAGVPVVPKPVTIRVPET